MDKKNIDSFRYWKGKSVAITGGASFIGSHLVDKLTEVGAHSLVIDNFSSGVMENLENSKREIEIKRIDLEWCDPSELTKTLMGVDVVFHLAAIHGGRGFIDTHPADVCSNFAIDHHVLESSLKAGVKKVVMASSACVYPPKLQSEYGSDYQLKETDTDPHLLEDPLSADIEYGWAKLMGEMQLLAFHKQYGLGGSSVRFVTAYGPRENETHAIIALIYKAVEHMDPYSIWGNGEQDRDFTYVSDIVNGTLLAGEKIDDCDTINLGTGKRYKLKEVAEEIFSSIKWHPNKIKLETDKPVGVISRSLDISKASKLLGWKPEVSLKEGINKTISWYLKSHRVSGKVDDKLLLERN